MHGAKVCAGGACMAHCVHHRTTTAGLLQTPRLLTCAARQLAHAAEITMFDDVIVVYKFFGDLMFFVTGSQDENELILYTVLQAFYESISLLLRCAQRHSRIRTFTCLR